jgi:regulator of cell morphogenesis and NO signaling
MLVLEDTKLIDIVNYNYHVLPVFYRFGIYPGFGDKTVGQLCDNKGINATLFLNIVNAFLDANYKPDKGTYDFTIAEIIFYLKRAHQDYLLKLEDLGKILSQVLSTCCSAKQKEVALVNNFFLSYKRDLIKHITFEDTRIFPYCLEVEQKLNSGKHDIEHSVDLHYYRSDHMNIENKIVDLKSIIVKYLPIDSPSQLLNTLIFEIYDFENDLFSHQSIEDRLLLPMVETILQNYKDL